MKIQSMYLKKPETNPVAHGVLFFRKPLGRVTNRKGSLEEDHWSILVLRPIIPTVIKGFLMLCIPLSAFLQDVIGSKPITEIEIAKAKNITTQVKSISKELAANHSRVYEAYTHLTWGDTIIISLTLTAAGLITWFAWKTYRYGLASDTGVMNIVEKNPQHFTFSGQEKKGIIYFRSEEHRLAVLHFCEKQKEI